MGKLHRFQTALRLMKTDGLLGFLHATLNYYLIRWYMLREAPASGSGAGGRVYRLVGPCKQIHCDTAQDLPVILESLCALHYEKVPGFSHQDGFTIVDVGANIGAYTLRAATRMKAGRIIAIEPNPTAYANLEANVRAISHPTALSLEMHQLGISAREPGRYPFQTGPLSMLGRFVDESSASASAEGILLPCEPLDQLCVALERVDILKIDVEGAELDVLDSASKTLEITDRVVLEYHANDLLEQIRSLLHARGFHQVGLFANDRYELGLAFFERRRGVSASA